MTNWRNSSIVAVALALWIGVSLLAGPAAQAQEAPWTLEDGGALTPEMREVITEQLDDLAAAGWYLHIFLVAPGTPVDGPDVAGVALPAPADPEIAEGTLVLVATSDLPPQWRVTGAGGVPPVGRAEEITFYVLSELDAAVQSGYPPELAFVDIVGRAVLPDHDDPSGTLDGDGDDGESGWRSFGLQAAAVTAVLTGLALLFHRSGTRHDATEIATVAALQPGTMALLEGTVVCDQPLWIEELGVGAVEAMWSDEKMKKATDIDVEYEHGHDSLGREQVTSHQITTVRELGWDTVLRSIRHHSVPFRIWDGTGQIWVSGDGAMYESSRVYESKRRGDRRSVVDGILVGDAVTVQGLVHQPPGGPLVIGDAHGPAHKGFIVSTTRSAVDILTRRRWGTIVRLVVGGGITAALLLLALVNG